MASKKPPTLRNPNIEASKTTSKYNFFETFLIFLTHFFNYKKKRLQIDLAMS